MLSLIRPNFNYGKIGWRYLTYSALSSGLKEALIECLKNNKLPSIGKTIPFEILINEYCIFIDTLSSLGRVTKTYNRELYDFWDGEHPINFRKLRIHDLYLKLKYQQIGDLVRKKLHKPRFQTGRLSKDHTPDFNTVYLNHDFTRGKGLFDIKILLGKITFNKNILVDHLLSVQLQGNQLRYCSYLRSDDLTKAQVKTLHLKIIPGVEQHWFNNNILGLYSDIIELQKSRKGDGTKKNGKKPGYDKFGDEFYFKYDTIALSEKQIELQKEKGIDSFYITIDKTAEHFLTLSNYIFDHRNKLKEYITGRTGIEYEL